MDGQAGQSDYKRVYNVADQAEKLAAGKHGFYFKDNRPHNALPVQSYAKNNNAAAVNISHNEEVNNTDLSNELKSQIENLSRLSMDDVKVHYNSDKPAQLQGHAYAQGTNIHLATGQEKHCRTKPEWRA